MKKTAMKKTTETPMKMIFEHDIVAAVRAATGAVPGDTIQIVTPQFTRTPDMPAVAAPPMDVVAWHQLKSMSKTALKEMGLAEWDDPDVDGRVLMLFPGEWYRHIPNGYEMEDVMGNPEIMTPGETDNDIRFGCLAYGIRVSAK